MEEVFVGADGTTYANALDLKATELTKKVEEYNFSLKRVEAALSNDAGNEDLKTLRKDLIDLVFSTEKELAGLYESNVKKETESSGSEMDESFGDVDGASINPFAKQYPKVDLQSLSKEERALIKRREKQRRWRQRKKVRKLEKKERRAARIIRFCEICRARGMGSKGFSIEENYQLHMKTRHPEWKPPPEQSQQESVVSNNEAEVKFSQD